MLDHPRFVRTNNDEPAVELSLESPADRGFSGHVREQLVLSTRATALLVDGLEYSAREELAEVTLRTLILTGGADRPDDDFDPEDVLKRLTAPGGGKRPTDREIERVAVYLKSSKIDPGLRWLGEELIEESRLTSMMAPVDLRTRRKRTNRLREIAKDL